MKSPGWDLNPRPIAYKATALPAELPGPLNSSSPPFSLLPSPKTKKDPFPILLESISKKQKEMVDLLLGSEVMASGKELGKELGGKKKGSRDKG